MSRTTSESVKGQLVDRIVRAGAGAGKTTRLTGHVLEVASEWFRLHGDWPSMVVTTFTRKATQELRERLMLKALQTGNPDLVSYVSAASRLQITTMHGVANLFLRQYAHLKGWDPGFQIMSAHEAHQMAKGLVKELVLNERPPGHDLVAPLGFDRLSRLLHRWSQTHQEDPEARAWTAPEMAAVWEEQTRAQLVRLQELAEQALAETVFETPTAVYFAGVAEWLRIIVASTGLPTAAELVTQAQSHGAKPRKSQRNPDPTEEVLTAWKAAWSGLLKDLQETWADPTSWTASEAFFLELGSLGRLFSERWYELKREAGRIEMEDLELLSLRLLREEPGLGRAFAAQWDYWLIDEFQDTSPRQVRLFSAFIGEKPSFVVGDPQQSIYLFRGARSEVFADREREIRETGGVLERLQTNYRSQPELVRFFNDFFLTINRDDSAASPFAPMEPRSKIELEIHHQLEDPESRSVAHFLVVPENNTEVSAVIFRIRELQQAGWRYEDISVLARTNRRLLTIAEGLAAEGIPTHLHTATGYSDRREILDALAVLKLFVNPYDNLNLLTVLRSPWCRVSDTWLVELLKGRPSFYWEAFLSHDGPMPESWQRLRAAYEMAQQIGVVAAFENLLVEWGMVDLCHHHEATGRREANLWKFVHQLRDEAHRPGFSLLKFLDRHSELMDLDQGEGDGDAVTVLEPKRVNLMTIHASKGLEFPHVILVGVSQRPPAPRSGVGDLPFYFDEETHLWSTMVPDDQDRSLRPTVASRAYQQKIQLRERAEQDRVLYVAMTRAIETVTCVISDPPQSGSWAARWQWDPPLDRMIVRPGPWPNEAKPSKAEPPPTHQVPIRSKLKLPADHPDEFDEPLSHLTVTGLIAIEPSHAEVTPADLMRRLDRTRHGVSFHRLMETLRYQPEALKEVELKDDIREALRFVQDLERPPMRQLLRSGYSEWGFQVRTSRGLLEGQIDLWGIVDGVVWIVDYKTGSPDHLDKAFAQLQLYAEAIEKLAADTPITLAVVYPFHQQVHLRAAPGGS